MARPGNTVVAEPWTAIPRAALVTLLLLMLRLAAVAPEPIVVATLEMADGAVVAATVDAPPVAKMP